MSKTEVICRFSQSTQESVFNNTAFQQWCQHHLTVPFLSFRKHPSCVCQEFDTGRAWVRKTYGCSIIWNMGDAWEQRSSCFHCYCGDTVLGVRSPTWLPCWSNMVWFPVAFWYLAFFSITLVTLPSGGGAHTIWGLTFRQLAHSVNLVLLTFQSRYILFLGVQGMQFNLIIEIGCLNCA